MNKAANQTRVELLEDAKSSLDSAIKSVEDATRGTEYQAKARLELIENLRNSLDSILKSRVWGVQQYLEHFQSKVKQQKHNDGLRKR